MNLEFQKFSFPNYNQTDKNGIIAIGGDLNPARLKLAYEKGIFPWYNEDEPVIWWFPNPRFVLFPEELKISKSMRKTLNSNQFHFTENQNFREVIENCSSIKRNGQSGTWILDEMIEAYVELHRQGLAKSVEVWKNDDLVGGFYGIEGKRIFCGESMFSKVPNASKAGFISFVQKHKNKYELFDCQVYTSHLESLGAREISSDEFLMYLT